MPPHDYPVIGPEDDLQAEAQRIYGPDAYVPFSKFDQPDAKVIGYLEVKGQGTYAVVQVPGSGKKGMVDDEDD